MFITLAAITQINLILIMSSETYPEVITDSGVIYGKKLDLNSISVDAYFGIPYAIPPEGRLRFQKSLPVKPWSKPIHATTLPPPCPQYAPMSFPWYDDGLDQSENCLFLNIWVPSDIRYHQSEGLSVIFYVHGGAFVFGSNRLEVFNGLALAAIGNVIVVTINFRLGPLGFLYSDSENAAGNMGMYDIVEGLKWVYNNIEAFRGNRKSITVASESSGAFMVGLMSVSPSVSYYFRRAIMLSGQPITLFQKSQKMNLVQSSKLAKAVGCMPNCDAIEQCSAQVVNCLKHIDAKELMKVSIDVMKRSIIEFIVQYDNDLVPASSIQSIRDSSFHISELLIGTNKDEGSIFIAPDYPDIFGRYGEIDAKVNKSVAVEIMKEGLHYFPEILDYLIEYYIGNLEEYDFDQIVRQIYAAVGDLVIVCGSVYYAERFAHRRPTYFYQFDHRSSNSMWSPKLGVTHFSAVEFMFGQPVLHPEKYNSEEIDLSKDIMQMWSNFSKYGIPSPSWPRYSRSFPFLKVLNIDTVTEVELLETAKNCNILRSYFGF